MHVGITRVYLAATLIHRHEHGFDTTGGLRHQRSSSRRRNRQTSDVATTILLQVGIQLFVSLFDAEQEGIVLLATGIKHGESTAFLRHGYGRAVGTQRQILVNVDRKLGCFWRSIAQSHGCNHVTFGRNADTCTASLTALMFNFLPKMIFCFFDLITLRIFLYLLQDAFNLLQLQINDIIHDALCYLNMLSELLHVKIGILGKRMNHIRIEVDAQQPARVIRAQRYFAAWIGAHGAETQVGITVGNAFTDDGIPEQYSWLCTLPGIVNNLSPESLGGDFSFHKRLITIHWELLHIRFVVGSCLHESVVYLDRYIGPGDLSLGHLGINKRFAVGMLDAHTQHQRATTAILRHLAGGIAVTLHERYQAGAGECRVVNW